LGTVLRDGDIISLEVKASRREACIKRCGEGVESGRERAEHSCWAKVGETEFHVGLRVRGAVVDGVNATAVDVANIIKMAEDFKTVILEGRPYIRR
jgi:hypothetical protein